MYWFNPYSIISIFAGQNHGTFTRICLYLYISASHLPVPEVLQPELVRELAGAHGVR